MTRSAITHFATQAGKPTSDDELLKQFLANRDAPCPNCGYNLRNLQKATCPECGHAIRLNVGLVDPKPFNFILGLFSLFVAIGFYLLLLSCVLAMKFFL